MNEAVKSFEKVKTGCAGCADCPLGKLIAEGKLGPNVDPQRFQAALARRRLLGGCGTEAVRSA